jgi:hypothetical protein
MTRHEVAYLLLFLLIVASVTLTWRHRRRMAEEARKRHRGWL